MRDTSDELERLLAVRYARLTPTERVRMTTSMFRAAKRLAEAGIRAQYPDATEVDVRVHLLHRLHSDLTQQQLADVAASWNDR